MNLVADVSMNTLIISAVVAGVGYALKGAAKMLGTVCRELILKLVETISKVEAMDRDLKKVIEAVGDVQKIRTDLNGFYSRLKEVEDKLKIQ